MKLLLYCTKGKPYLIQGSIKPMHTLDANNPYNFNWKVVKKGFSNDKLNSKIVGECDFEVEEIFEDNFEDARDGYVEHFYTLKSYDDFDEGENVLLKESCLQKHELSNYLGFENGYAIHIKNLKIFDKPRDLEEVYKIDDVGGKFFTHSLKNAPQNMMHVSANRWTYDFYEPNDINILISIKPEWLCKILNGEKTIEVRKKVLKEMK